MKNKKILLSLIFVLALSSCANTSQGEKASVSDSTIEDALNSEEKADKEKNKEEDTKDSKNKDKKEDTDKKEEEKIDYDKWREYITGVGEFDEEVLDEISDEDIKDYYLRAKATCEKTGYWDVKDIVFQQIAKDYPDYSNKFPYDFIDDIYNWKESTDEVTDKFADERVSLIEQGYGEDQVYEISDKDLEKSFKKAYKENEEGLYLDYIRAVGKDLFGEVQVQEETYENNNEKTLLSLGESQADYDEFRAALVNAYGFSQESVDQMSNYDLDLAYTRAQQRLEETGFGDIGLIINEIAKMYPDSSDMYPGY